MKIVVFGPGQRPVVTDTPYPGPCSSKAEMSYPVQYGSMRRGDLWRIWDEGSPSTFDRET
jgi:hypothetical protein